MMQSKKKKDRDEKLDHILFMLNSIDVIFLLPKQGRWTINDVET